MAPFGEKVWFRNIGRDGVNSLASRMLQEIFVGHHDRTGSPKVELYQAKSWTTQPLNDAWDATKLGWHVWYSVVNGES